MQETQRPDGTILREFFADSPGGRKAMEERLQTLQGRGHTIVGRKIVGWNDECPCNSGRKFKKCCGRGLR